MEAICQVSLKAISSNYQFFKERMGKSKIIPVVKANAYGHGALEVSKHLHELEEVDLFAVATLQEARELAASLPAVSTLIFSRVFTSELDQLPERAILTLVSMEHAEALGNTGKTIDVHLNVNTGMNRLGVSPEEARLLIKNKYSNLNIVGVYSHFSSSDTASHRQFEKQRALFESFVSDIRTLGFRGLVHMSNSAAMLHDDFNTYDAMRLGIGLYGYDTSPGGSHQAALRPAMQVIAPLVRVDQVKAGEPVSYAEKWHADRDTNIGTLRIGYADGYNRLLTNNGSVSLNDEEFPVVGTVTMDHIMIDLGHKRIEPGTYFTVLGGDKRPVSIADVADRLGTIPYEVCCGISRRVQRIHLID